MRAVVAVMPNNFWWGTERGPGPEAVKRCSLQERWLQGRAELAGQEWENRRSMAWLVTMVGRFEALACVRVLSVLRLSILFALAVMPCLSRVDRQPET